MNLLPLVRKATGSGLGFILSSLLSFFVSILLSRALNVDDFGEIVIAISIALVASQIAQLGFMRASIKFVAEISLSGNLNALRSYLFFSFFAVLFSSAVVAFAVYSIFNIYYQGLNSSNLFSLFAALMVWPFAVNRLLAGVLLGYKKSFLGSFAQNGFAYLGILIALLLGLTVPVVGLNINIVFSIIICVYILTILLLILFNVRSSRIFHSFRSLSFSPLEYFSTSLPIMLLGTTQIANKQASILIIGSMLNASDVAQYFPAFRISEFATFGLIATNAVVGPRIVEAFSEGNRYKLQSILNSAALFSFLSTVIISSFILLFMNPLFSLFDGSAYEGRIILLVLLFGQIANGAIGSVGFVMCMTGQQKFAAQVSFLILLFTIVSQYFLVNLFGIFGAALSVAVSTILWNCILFMRARHALRVNTSVLGFLNCS